MDLPLERQGLSIVEAKRRLLDWSEADDRLRAERAKNPLKKAAIFGGGALIAAVVLRRGFGGLRKVATWAMLARALPVVLPIVTKALNSKGSSK